MKNLLIIMLLGVFFLKPATAIQDEQSESGDIGETDVDCVAINSGDEEVYDSGDSDSGDTSDSATEE